MGGIFVGGIFVGGISLEPVINSVLRIVINIQNKTIFEHVIITGFYTSIYIYMYISAVPDSSFSAFTDGG